LENGERGCGELLRCRNQAHVRRKGPNSSSPLLQPHPSPAPRKQKKSEPRNYLVMSRSCALRAVRSSALLFSPAAQLTGVGQFGGNSRGIKALPCGTPPWPSVHCSPSIPAKCWQGALRAKLYREEKKKNRLSLPRCWQMGNRRIVGNQKGPFRPTDAA
jgi:hypothetical protein